jgi:tetratricopeptide (TPR) repeat protein
VSSPNQRSALAALNQVRATVSRLDISRHPEDVAADLIEGWNGTEIALRSLLGGSALSGQPLIRELRQRELLSLAQAHALIEFLAARDRAQRTDYRPTSADIAAARHGFQELEGALIASPAADLVAAPVPPSGYVGGVSPPAPRAVSHQQGTATWKVALGAFVLVALLGIGGYFVYQWWDQRDERAIRRAAALYQRGDRPAARRAFEDVSRDHPDNAEPYIYLGRIAREEGDMTTARERLVRAIELEPDNALAQREMGTVLFLSGNFDVARRFYDRAIRLDQRDRLSQGMMGCTLVRLGRPDLAANFLRRAGQGEWNRVCPLPIPPA